MMLGIETMTAVILWAVIALGILACTFYLGGEWRVKHYWVPAQDLPHADTATPAGFTVEEPHPSDDIRGEVIELPPIQIVTASIDVIRSPEIVRENDTLSAGLVHALARIAVLEDALKAGKEKIDHLEQLRDRHWRSVKIARARLNFVIGPVLDAPRRPSREKLAAEIIDIGTSNHPARVHAIPPAIINEWREAAA